MWRLKFEHLQQLLILYEPEEIIVTNAADSVSAHAKKEEHQQ